MRYNQVEKTADKIEKALEKMGFELIYREESRASCSEYISVEFQDFEAKIRISNHDLPSHYRRPDFDVQETSVTHKRSRFREGSWVDAIEWIAEKTGKPVPSSAKGARSRAVNIQKRHDEKCERMARERGLN
jgi:tRNA nucleotidyltransferase (CCA-adding enzyme)